MVYGAKHFAYVNSFAPNNDPMNYEPLLFLSYRYGNWGIESFVQGDS